MEKLGLEKLRLGSSKLAPKHQRNPTLGARAAAVSVLNPPPPPGLLLKSFHSRSCADYSPLAKSVPAFSPEALADSQVLQEGRTAASPARGDRIPAKHAEAPPPRRDQGSLERRDSLAPAGSAWNPWQGEGCRQHATAASNVCPGRLAPCLSVACLHPPPHVCTPHVPSELPRVFVSVPASLHPPGMRLRRPCRGAAAACPPGCSAQAQP